MLALLPFWPRGNRRREQLNALPKTRESASGEAGAKQMPPSRACAVSLRVRSLGGGAGLGAPGPVRRGWGWGGRSSDGSRTGSPAQGNRRDCSFSPFMSSLIKCFEHEREWDWIFAKMKERNLFPSGTFTTLRCQPAGSTSVQPAQQFENSSRIPEDLAKSQAIWIHQHLGVMEGSGV